MKVKRIIILVVSLAFAVIAITANAYIYSQNFEAEIAYKTNIRSISAFKNLDKLNATKTLRGQRAATFENLDLGYEPTEEFEYVQVYSFTHDNTDLTVISSDGTSAQIPTESAKETQLLLGQTWAELVENDNVEVTKNANTTTILLTDVASVSNEFKQMLQDSLLVELEAIFEGFSVDSLDTEFQNNFDATVVMQDNKIKNITFNSSSPILLSYSLTKVSSEDTEINDDVLKGKLAYSNLEVIYQFAELEFSPNIPTNSLLLLGYSILY